MSTGTASPRGVDGSAGTFVEGVGERPPSTDGLANGRQHRPRPPRGIGLGDRGRQRSSAAQAPRRPDRTTRPSPNPWEAGASAAAVEWPVATTTVRGSIGAVSLARGVDEPTSRRTRLTTTHRDDGEEGDDDRAAAHGRPRRRSSDDEAVGDEWPQRQRVVDDHLADLDDSARRVAGSGDVHDDVDRAGELLAGRASAATPARRRGSTSRAGAAHRARCWRGRSTTTPSWPVFKACTRATTSGPRTSPTTSRSGRSRRAVRTSCSNVMATGPSGRRRSCFEPDEVGHPWQQLGGVLDDHEPFGRSVPAPASS